MLYTPTNHILEVKSDEETDKLTQDNLSCISFLIVLGFILLIVLIGIYCLNNW